MKPRSLPSKLLVAVLLAALCTSVGCESKKAEPSSQEKTTEKAPAREPAEADDGATAEKNVASKPADEVSTETGDGDLVGRVSRQMIEEQEEAWKTAIAHASPDSATAKALAEVEPGAEITIYFGAWCSDCQRELPRFFKALDIAGDVPFTYELIGLDQFFQADEVSQEPIDLPAVPTFVVTRDGEEVGRVVEKAPRGIEKDILALLRGEATGEISATRE